MTTETTTHGGTITGRLGGPTPEPQDLPRPEIPIGRAYRDAQMRIDEERTTLERYRLDLVRLEHRVMARWMLADAKVSYGRFAAEITLTMEASDLRFVGQALLEVRRSGWRRVSYSRQARAYPIPDTDGDGQVFYRFSKRVSADDYTHNYLAVVFKFTGSSNIQLKMLPDSSHEKESYTVRPRVVG